MNGLRKMWAVLLISLFFSLAIAGMGGAQEGKVDVNMATVEELVQIKGIGKAIAERIIAERTANGPYKSVEDLQRVKGIGAKSLEKIRAFVMVSVPEEKNPS